MKKIISITFLLIFVLLPHIVLTATIGEECTSNGDCTSGDCEKASTGKWYCDCNTDGDCDIYKNGTEHWDCIDGADASYDMDYCQKEGATTADDVKFPIPPRDPSLTDLIFDSTASFAVNVDELEKIIAEPRPSIRIPGLDFTDKNIVAKNTSERSDGSYLNIPYLGEYLAAVYKWIIAAVGIFAVLRIVAAGFGWVMSGGSAEKIKEEQSKIKNALIGLFLAVGSYTLLFTINPELVNFRNLQIRLIQGFNVDGTVFLGNSIYKDLINKEILPTSAYEAMAITAGRKAGFTDDCIMTTLLKMESGGRPDAIGHDENVRKDITARRDFLKSGRKYSGATFSPETDFTKKIYNDDNSLKNGNCNNLDTLCLDWRFSHGIGLTQVTIFKGQNCNGGQPGRENELDKKCYSPLDLLDPQKNLDYGINLLKYLFDTAGKKGFSGEDQLLAAYMGYNGGGGKISQAAKNITVLRNHDYPTKAKNYLDKCHAMR